MKKFTKILILSIFTILIVGSFTKSAFAETPPLSVTFSSDPLFKEVNFIPGGEVTSSVSVSNNSGSSQNIIVEATNALDTSGLGDKLNLIIKEGDSIKYNNTLGKFLRDGEVSLSSLANENSTNYSFNIIFDSGTENNLQGKNLGFDLCIGFQGGNMHCGNTVISDENGGGNSSSISGSSGSTITLVIYNEQAINISNVGTSGSATITWSTNKLSTSQVIYGVYPGPYNLNLNTLPNLGYPLGSIEDNNKVMNHSVVLTGLIPGETYVYRVVSHSSPATVSYEHKFTVPIFALENNKINNILNNNGKVLGAEDEQPILETNTDEKFDNNQSGENLNKNLLGASAGNIMGLPNIWFWILLFIILLLIIFKIIMKRKRNK